MKKIMLSLLGLGLVLWLGGCASDELLAPCPHFGAYCTKTPINSWDYKN